jgi:hypothetical protein
MFETIGISDNWNIQTGIADLAEIGSFDEVLVGRNWMNHGVQKYVVDMNAKNIVPQVLVLVQSINADSLPLIYGPLVEVLRLVGHGELLDWSKHGFKIPSINLATETARTSEIAIGQVVR